ncbi:hypothetical protein AMK34_21960 [Amycolatopsis sp. CB00013]|nr:hypothetical protein AMK34_21960 [Amycolatopsis sp. CB00013]
MLVTRLNLPLDDGSYLVLTGLADKGSSDEELSGRAHTLNVADFLRDAVLAGVSGNFSYDMLKAVGIQLRSRGLLVKRPQPSAADVTETAVQWLESAGHPGVLVSRAEQLADKSWSVEGTVVQGRFDARVDPEGQVMQIRVR